MSDTGNFTSEANRQGLTELERKMHILRDQFQTRCFADALLMEQMLGTGVRSGDAPDLQPLRSLVHRMAGAAAVFEQDDLCDAAKRVEELTEALPVTPGALEASIRTLTGLIRGLKPSNFA